MKNIKTILTIIIVGVLAVSLTLLIGPKAEIKTIAGDSAYDIAVKYGFEGTEEEWLLSLHGSNGKDGRDGLNGRDGVDGIDGKDGRDGVDGKDGVDGINGVDGQDGKDGYTPVKGVDYFDGKDGINGKDGVNGKDGIDGRDGRDGKDGRDGVNGIDGKDGVDGKDGKDGKDFTPITEESSEPTEDLYHYVNKEIHVSIALKGGNVYYLTNHTDLFDFNGTTVTTKACIKNIHNAKVVELTRWTGSSNDRNYVPSTIKADQTVLFDGGFHSYRDLMVKYNATWKDSEIAGYKYTSLPIKDCNSLSWTPSTETVDAVIEFDCTITVLEKVSK